MSPRTTEPTDGRCDHAVPRFLAGQGARSGDARDAGRPTKVGGSSADHRCTALEVDADLVDKLARIRTCELIGAISYTFDGRGEERYGVRSTKWNTFNSADRTAGELPLPRLAQLRGVHRRRRGIRLMDQAVEQDVNFFDKANH